MSLNGKVALVTGSSRGIGKAIAIELAKQGAHVVVNYFRRTQAAESTCQEIVAHGVRALPVRAHMGKADQICALFDRVEETFGGVDLLVCNAAMGVLRPVLEVDERSWEWTMAINARSVLLCTQRAAPLMEARGGGRIVAITSVGISRILPFYAMTGASKGAIETLVRYLAVELAAKGIRANCVSPGAVLTDEWLHYPSEDRDDLLGQIARRTPIGRLATPQDVAKAVAFLCGPDATAITGQTLVVDGGFSLSL